MAKVRCINDFVWTPEPNSEQDDTPKKRVNRNINDPPAKTYTLPWLVKQDKKPLSKMKKYDVSELNRSTVHREFLHVKYCVISAEYVFSKLYRKCVKVQLDTLAYDDSEFRLEMSKWISSKRYRKHNSKPTKKHNSYIYTNNYIIFVDTVFRMVTLFDRYIKNLKNRRCEYENVVLINDISWTSIPRCHQMWNFETKSYCTREKIASMMIQDLKLISEIFLSSELDEFETFNTYLMKTFPELYHIDYFHPRARNIVVTREGKEKLHQRFMYLASLLQMQLSMKEIYLAWMVVFDVIAKRKNIQAFTMIEPWSKHNTPKIIIEHQYTERNKFAHGQWVGMVDRHEGKIDNVNTMNALGDWRRFKCKYSEITDKKLIQQIQDKRTAKSAGKQTKKRMTKIATVNVSSANNANVTSATSNVNDITAIQLPVRSATPMSKRVKRKKVKRKRAATPKPAMVQKKMYWHERYRNDSDVFDFNIIHIFSEQKCLFVTRKFVPYPNIFYFKSKAAHYPIASKKYSKCELDSGARLVKYTPHNRTLLSCFDDISRECAERVLDLNDGLRIMMFDDVKALYTNDTVGENVIRPDGFSEYDYSWITKEMIYDFMPDVITKFNKHYKTEVV